MSCPSPNVCPNFGNASNYFCVHSFYPFDHRPVQSDSLWVPDDDESLSTAFYERTEWNRRGCRSNLGLGRLGRLFGYCRVFVGSAEFFLPESFGVQNVLCYFHVYGCVLVVKLDTLLCKSKTIETPLRQMI